jgi:Fe/S biogenesis protein NfuA
MITLTERARDKVLELLRSQDRKNLALRFGVEGRGPGGFRYQLRFVPADERAPADRVVDAGGLEILVDAGSAPKLEGASVDYVETLQGSGFKIENPNSVWSDPVAAAVQRLLDDEINPAVASHGGYVTLLDVKDGVAYVEMSGGCQGCGMADVTLRQGIELRIREAVAEVRSVVDATDHAGGTNPYYQSAGDGRSPLS